jgi:selenide,water dikinase
MEDESLIVGLETSDDAAVYKINDDLAMIQTLDFFTPVVDDPYTFGQIAATNSLSDIYAMGGEPKLALNIVCFPDCLSPNVLGEILRGGADKVKEAGAILVGGHSVSDDEPKYGLSVTGFVSPDKVLVNSNARIGDLLILTKPIGLGVVNTAIKAEFISESVYDEAIKIMTTLNKYGKEAIDKVEGVHSVTDITGFGLLGHALEMAEGSDKTIKIYSNSVPIIEGAKEYAEMGLIPAGAYSNKRHIGNKVKFDIEIEKYLEDLLFDPQTSGGLLISVKKENAEKLLKELETSPIKCAIIGEVCKKSDSYLVVE